MLRNWTKSNLEAIRKFLTIWAKLSSSRLAIMARRAVAWSQSVQPQRPMANVNHGSTGGGLSFRGLTVSSGTPVPGVGPFHHPALLPGGQAFAPFRTRLHCAAPVRSLGRHPGVKRVGMILTIATADHQARKVVWRACGQQHGGGNAVVDACPRAQDGHQQTPRVDQPRALAPLDLLAAVIPARGVGSRPACTRRGVRQAATSCAQGPASLHWAQ